VSEPQERDQGYEEVEYLQFAPTPRMRIVLRVLRALVTPTAWLLAVAVRWSDTLFRSASEALSTVPYAPGVILRSVFYRHALRSCGENLITEFGTVFVYPDVTVGDNVLIGRFTVIHHCDIGDYVLIGERCTFLSGSRQHRFERADVPMALQGGQRRRIGVGRDCWIGSHAVVMNDIGTGSVVAAGSVVTGPVEDRSVVAGNPARLRRRRATAAPHPAPPPEFPVASEEVSR
jgi:acetyltransferase-like isoleucine patch superfamily enzyme